MSKPVAKRPIRPGLVAAPANDNTPEAPGVRLAGSSEPGADETADALLLQLYATIRELGA